MRNLFFLSFLVIFAIYGCSKDDTILEDAEIPLKIPINTSKTSVSDIEKSENMRDEQKTTVLSFKSSIESEKSGLPTNSNIGFGEGIGDFGSPSDGFEDPVDGFGPNNDPDTDVDGDPVPFPPYLGCPEWIPPVESLDTDQGELIHVYYNPILVALDEINCVRKDIFEKHCYLRMSRLQDDQDPYHDIWVAEFTLGCSPPTPGSAGVTTNGAPQPAKDDDRACVRNRCQ